MATYKVYLRTKGSSTISWQFSTTVVAATQDAAVESAFTKWKGEAGSTAPASLSDCDIKCDLV